MLLVLFTWIYMLLIFSVQGEWLNRLFFKKSLESVGETVLVGMIFQTVIVSLAAFFIRVGVEYVLFNVVFTSVLAFIIRKDLVARWRTIRSLKWNLWSKVFFFAVFGIVLVNSATLPFLTNNESYYIQCVKWLNHYGWVKGLANLHMFFANSSPWHALQASCNFSFLCSLFNDLNGFLTCLMAFLWIEKLNILFQNNENRSDRWLFFLPFPFLLWMFFINSPSIDLPLSLISFVIFYHTLYRTDSGSLLSIICAVFLVFLKPSIAPVLLLMCFHINKSNLKFTVFYTLLLGGVYIARNIILTGSPFAPYLGIQLGVPWVVSPDMMLDKDLLNFKSFQTHPEIDIAGWAVILLVLLIYMILIRKEKKHYPLAIYFVAQIIFLFLTFSQFRFALPAFTFPLVYILSKIGLFRNREVAGMAICLVIAAIPLFIDLKLERFSSRPELLRMDTFSPSYLVKPAGITKFPHMEFKKSKLTNFYFYDPVDSLRFRYFTGNGPLPCVESEFFHHMYRKTKTVTVTMGDDIGDGFERVPLPEEEGED